jgi:biotin carboxyl carrier protein
MEHRVTAPTDAVVAAVRFAVGDRVDMGDLLVELDDDAGDDEGDQ